MRERQRGPMSHDWLYRRFRNRCSAEYPKDFIRAGLFYSITQRLEWLSLSPLSETCKTARMSFLYKTMNIIKFYVRHDAHLRSIRRKHLFWHTLRETSGWGDSKAGWVLFKGETYVPSSVSKRNFDSYFSKYTYGMQLTVRRKCGEESDWFVGQRKYVIERRRLWRVMHLWLISYKTYFCVTWLEEKLLHRQRIYIGKTSNTTLFWWTTR